MKNITCPISSERISDNLPRLIGSFVVILLFMYVIYNLIFIPLLLSIDFYFRGFNKNKYSLLAKLSKAVNNKLPNKGKLIDKAPKMFAARLGFVFTILTLVGDLLGLTFAANRLALILIIFASLECVFNFCVGCVVFTWFVKPHLQS